jgi:hemolysin activation/secretion protein
MRITNGSISTLLEKCFAPCPAHLPTIFLPEGKSQARFLLPSEQLGIGGYDSVRGYDERQYNADTGFFMNHEIHFPSFSLFRIRKTNADRMYFLVFFDLGVGMDNRSIFGVKEWDYLIGVGPGVRYSLSSYLTGHLDYGFKLHHQDNFTGSDIGMIHFSITGGY